MFAPGFVNYKKGALDSQPQVIQFISCLPMVGGSHRVPLVSSTTKTGRHDIAEILLKVALNTPKIKKNHWSACIFIQESERSCIYLCVMNICFASFYHNSVVLFCFFCLLLEFLPGTLWSHKQYWQPLVPVKNFSHFKIQYASRGTHGLWYEEPWINVPGPGSLRIGVVWTNTLVVCCLNCGDVVTAIMQEIALQVH